MDVEGEDFRSKM